MKVKKVPAWVYVVSWTMSERMCRETEQKYHFPAGQVEATTQVMVFTERRPPSGTAA